MGKKRPRTFKRINPKKIAKALGARHITDPKEKIEFEEKYGFPHPSVPMVPKPKHKKIAFNGYFDLLILRTSCIVERIEVPCLDLSFPTFNGNHG